MRQNEPGIVEYYDLLAEDYDSRWVTFVDSQQKVIKPFADKVKEAFGDNARVADLGCGVGLNSYILSEIHDSNFTVMGVDISKQMIKKAQKNCPKATCVHENFLSWKTDSKFHGIVAGSFLNQFSSEMQPYVVEKMHDIMEKGAYALVYASDTQDFDDNKTVLLKKKPYMQMVHRINVSDLLSQFFEVVDYYKGYGKRNWSIMLVRKK